MSCVNADVVVASNDKISINVFMSLFYLQLYGAEYLIEHQ